MHLTRTDLKRDDWQAPGRMRSQAEAGTSPRFHTGRDDEAAAPGAPGQQSLAPERDLSERFLESTAIPIAISNSDG